MFQRDLAIITERLYPKSNRFYLKSHIFSSSVRILSFLFLTVVVSCQSEGDLIGGEFIENKLEVTVDTVYITDITSTSIPSFTGGRLGDTSVLGISNVSFGQYSDPLFGNTLATALFRPGLFTASAIDTLNEESLLKLRFVVNTTVGDTNDVATFELWEIGRVWRGNVWRPDSSISPSLTNLLTTFTIANEDTVEVDLPNEWKEKLKNVIYSDNPDSAYRSTIFGFAAVPVAGNKIVSVNGSQSLLSLTHSFLPEKDSTSSRVAVIRSWAYSYSIENPQMSSNLLPLDNLLENMISFDISADSDFLGTDNALRAEFVLTEDTLSLRNTLSDGHERPKDNEIEIFLLSEADVLFDIGPLSPTFTGIKPPTDNTFRVNLSAILNNQFRTQEDNRRFYISYKSNGIFGKGIDGTLYRTVLFGPNSENPPYLIITKALPVE